MKSNREVVTSYFAACSRGDVQAITDSFCENATIYDTNHPPVHGPVAIAKFWTHVREDLAGATWHVDTFIDDDKRAAVEWTMRFARDESVVLVRGSEHYELEDGRIHEIRQYWTHNPDDMSVGLREFPYSNDARFTG